MNEEKKLTDEAVNATVKSLKWICNQIPNDLGNSNEEKMLKCIQLYCEQGATLILRLQKENERYKAVNRLLEQDVANLHKEREKRVEEVYADFMQDYKIMRDELNECCDENGKLQEALRSIPQAICDNTYPDFDKAGKPVNVWKAREGYDKIDEILKAVGVR